jgi:peroxiredoxin
MSVDLGSIAPNFELASSTGETFSLKQFKNDKIVILSFHPMSFTGG